MIIHPILRKLLIFFFTISLVVSLFFFIRSTDLRTVSDLVQKTGYRFLVLLGITGLAYLVGTVSWQFTLGNYANFVSTGRLFLIRHVGEIAGMFNPTSVIGGDAVKAILLREKNIPEKTIMASVLLSRLVMIGTQILLLAIMTLAFVLQHPSGGIYRSVADTRSGSYLPLVVIWKSLVLKIKSMLLELPVLVKGNKRMLLFSCLFALTHWGIGGLEFYFIIKFLGFKASVFQALIVDLGVVVFKTLGAFVPGQLGIEEYGNKIMLMVIGLPGEEVWIAASILRRARQLFWITFGVAIYFIVFKKKRLVVQS